MIIVEKNDHFTNAIALSGNVVTFSGTLSNATIEDWEPEDSCSYDFFGPSVWWSWTATQSTAVVVETLQHSPTYGSAFAALKGTEIWALTPLDCNFMDPITNRYLSFLATSGTTYYIRVFGASLYDDDGAQLSLHAISLHYNLFIDL